MACKDCGAEVAKDCAGKSPEGGPYEAVEQGRNRKTRARRAGIAKSWLGAETHTFRRGANMQQPLKPNPEPASILAHEVAKLHREKMELLEENASLKKGLEFLLGPVLFAWGL